MEPVNFEVYVQNKLQQIEDKRIKKEKFQEQLADCDTIKASNMRLAELSDLCKQYGMPDFTEKGIKLSDR